MHHVDANPDCPQRLVRALKSAAAYPHAVATVEVVETHISWVLLTGTYAYKIKKPVNLGFLDFSTLEQRQHFSHEELRLNQRLAPEFYLDVVPITGTLDAPQIGGPGEPIEFAVRMRQFPQEALLSRLIAQGSLTAGHIDCLAAEIAQFHCSIAVAPPASAFGLPDTVWAPMQENFDHIGTGPDPAAVAHIERLRDWSRQEFVARRDEFLSRKESGFVRECHGDLHLGNMFLDHASVVIFDCIEFNDSFRWIDVVSETAFAVMDLQDRGRPDFAARLLNAYLERTGDYPGLSVLRYYLVYRALVRAKVAWIRGRQQDVAATDKERLRREFQGYLDLAATYTASIQPLLIITHGVSGSGKTTLTQPLLERLQAVRIRSDVERKRLFGLEPSESSRTATGENLYSPAATERTYAHLAELAAAALQAGRTVIIDATFLKRAQRQAFRGLAERLHVPFVILDFVVRPEVLRQRISRRIEQHQDASDADLNVLDWQLESRELLDPAEQAIAIRVDESPEALEHAILNSPLAGEWTRLDRVV